MRGYTASDFTVLLDALTNTRCCIPVATQGQRPNNAETAALQLITASYEAAERHTPRAQKWAMDLPRHCKLRSPAKSASAAVMLLKRLYF